MNKPPETKGEPYPGEGNINGDPLFVSETFIEASFTDHFDDGDIDGWTVWSGNWDASQGGFLSLSDTTGSSVGIHHDQPEDDMALWFSYRRMAGDDSRNFRIQLRRDSAGTIAELFLQNNGIHYLREKLNGVWTTVADDDCDEPLAANTWYDYYVRLEGRECEVWRAERGQEMLPHLIANTANQKLFTVTETEKLYLVATKNSAYDIDYIRFTHNWREFLHLDSGSACIDKGDTDHLGDDEDRPPIRFRDFDNMMGPLTEGATANNQIERDMGADEFPTPIEFVYWWENY